MPKSINSTNLVILLENPTTALYVRPISCYSVVFKCIAKLICKWLKVELPILSMLIKVAVVHGIELVHNVLLC